MSTVRILGGGLSGLATAVLVAQRGTRVEVRDRRRGGGGRFTGGFQILENGSCGQDVLEELEQMALAPDCELTPLHEAVLLDADRRRWEVRSSKPYAYLVRRGAGPGTVDHWLRSQAEASGVSLETGSETSSWTADVHATGPRYADGVAREVVFKTSHPNLMAVLFDPRLTPTGYAYLFVREGFGTMGAAQVRRLAELRRNAERAFAILLEEFPMPLENAHEHGQFMNFAMPGHLSSSGRWYVGEAAGVQEFLFGLGNRLGLRSAALVAEAIAGSGWDQGRFREGLVRPMTVSILGRAAFELAGPSSVGRLCAWLAGADFRERLIALQRPSAIRRFMARAVMLVWRHRGPSPRLPVARWRRREER
ncbi:MAG: NAD(P)-binding protein [Acidobacteria bacterium]|nr:NAD(P)-binding protein [Acidobacteriota bacterium]